jgi:hypothetical protein
MRSSNVLSRRTRRTAPVAALGVAALVLTSCSSSANDDAGPTPSASMSPTPTSTVNVPASVSLTAPGTKLRFGDPASVIFEPDQKRGSVLKVSVDKAVQGSIKDLSAFVLKPEVKASTPYYVDVTVENLGEGDVGGVPVPLWGVDGDNTLLPAAGFTTAFPRCPSEQLPKKFGPGDSLETCLVFLAPDGGTMQAVSYRPDEAFNPITWTGDIATPKPQPKKSSKQQKKDQQKKERRR